jgi:hypothetical protein
MAAACCGATPDSTVVAALTLALGIGATTAIFSIVNAVLWRGLPYQDAGQLVQLWETNPDRNWTDAECAAANFADWQRENQSFEGFILIAIGVGGGVALTLMSGRLMSGLLFGVNAFDPVSHALVILLLCSVAACAVFAPIRRALRVSPLIALRAE